MNRRRASAAAWIAAWLWLAPGAGAAVAAPALPPAAPLEQVLNEGVPAELAALDVPGAALAVVRRGEPVLLAGFGAADPVTGEPVDPGRHVFRIGSVSKPLTATVVLRVLHRHGLALHADLTGQLDALPVQPPLQRPLTMHHLLTHTAGFNEQLFGQHVSRAGRVGSLTGYLQRHLPPRFAEPGRLIAYNDHHTVLAGWVAERLAGADFTALAERWLLEPLNMSATTFRQTDLPAAVADHRVRAWQRRGAGWQPYAWDFIRTAPAAGAWSSAADMAAYLQALLDCEAGRVLEPSVCRRQLSRQAGHHPRLPGRAYGFAEGRHGDLRVLYKDGQASGFNARLLLVPERGLGVFVAHNRNILGGFGALLPAARFNREVTGLVLETLYPSPAATAPSPPRARRSDRLARYAGDYRNVVAARHSWERFVGMFDDVHVTPTARGVDFGFGEYLEVAPGLVQWHEGGNDYRAFAVEGGRASHLFIGGGAYERIPWYGASWFTPWFLLAVSGWFAATLVLSLITRRGWDRLVAAVPALCFLGFLAGSALLLGDVQALFHGPPAALLVLLALPLVGGVALLLPPLAMLHGRRGGVSATAVAALNLLIGAAFLLWLHYWNLLGYHLG